MDAPAASNAPTAASLQRKEAYTPLASFTLALIQAMLRTGYYAADHPEAKKSMTGLYAQFAELVEGRSGLTYSLLEKQEYTEITVDGYTEVATPLHQVMVSGMADLFTPKFLDFFSRWKLLSFSIRPDTTQEEFDTFVELMSQVPSGGPIQQANERLTQALIDHNIINISAVFRHEMVGRERRLPWRVRMALTRLRRDLRVLPMYKKATKEQMLRIKLQIIDDTIRPIRTPTLLKDFLTNYDLIAADVVELEESQVEREIVANLGEEMLVGTAHQIIEELKKLGQHSRDDRRGGVRGNRALRRRATRRRRPTVCDRKRSGSRLPRGAGTAEGATARAAAGRSAARHRDPSPGQRLRATQGRIPEIPSQPRSKRRHAETGSYHIADHARSAPSQRVRAGGRDRRCRKQRDPGRAYGPLLRSGCDPFEEGVGQRGDNRLPARRPQTPDQRAT
jgi:hypothetical protein